MTSLLDRFRPVTLAQIESASLMNRTDTKFALTDSQFRAFLPALMGDYRVLEIQGTRQHHYQTLYLDTPGFALYFSHHAGRAVRHKVRLRTYVDTGISFLEIKLKRKNGRTVKHRRAIDGSAAPFDAASTTAGVAALLPPNAPAIPGPLEPKLWNDFHRVTLVNTLFDERLTLDRNVSFRDYDGRTVALPGIVIAEVKQRDVDHSSPFMRQMKALRLHPISVSKYCTGVALLYSEIKHNTFKPTLLRLKQLMRGESHAH